MYTTIQWHQCWDKQQTRACKIRRESKQALFIILYTKTTWSVNVLRSGQSKLRYTFFWFLSIHHVTKAWHFQGASCFLDGATTSFRHTWWASAGAAASGGGTTAGRPSLWLQSFSYVTLSMGSALTSNSSGHGSAPGRPS